MDVRKNSMSIRLNHVLIVQEKEQSQILKSKNVHNVMDADRLYILSVTVS